MEIGEHFYADDPAQGPADVRTTLPGVEYYFLGNGRIQAAVQIAPAGGATPLGLLIMDPDRLGPKRAALSFDPDLGLAATLLTVTDGRATHRPHPGAVKASWLRGSVEPRVEVVWTSGPYRVTEAFFCPDMGTARLLRRVTLVRTAAGASKVLLSTGLGSRAVRTGTRFRGRVSAPVTFEYRIAKRDGRPAAFV